MQKKLFQDSEWVFTASGKVRLLKEGIVHVHINPGHQQTPENAHENLQAARFHCHTIQRCVILDLRGARPLTPDTRAVYSDKDIAKYFLGLAMVVKTDRISQLMANVYMKVSGKPIPMRLCFDFEEGKNWLNKLSKATS
ncbi:MAG: hypothetical protein K0R29_1986 [Pseudobdellovibrio sp.]|jgi:hypothetical protein|nr:hypothetical protein [Pseudobdellovibrio sp.]